MEFWVAKGLFQLYLSCLTYTIVHTASTSDFSRSVMLYRTLSSAVMAAMGCFYILSGALCFGQLRRARMRKARRRPALPVLFAAPARPRPAPACGLPIRPRALLYATSPATTCTPEKPLERP